MKTCQKDEQPTKYEKQKRKRHSAALNSINDELVVSFGRRRRQCDKPK